jgi:FtsP/CotA-like multicopper oxidase with cupredoxin domain
MRNHRIKGMRLGLLMALVLLLSSVASVNQVQPASAQMDMGSNGLVCTTSPTASFNLTTKTGYIGTPDDNVVFMWGFSVGGGPFQHPSPVLCVNEDDVVTITLQNNLPVDISIVFPGQDDVLANGAPVQPQFAVPGDPSTLTSLTNVAAANGGSITYSFVANHPGTFIYQSGTDPDIQIHMGLFGAIVVRPMMGAMHANNRMDSMFTMDSEFLVLFSEIDPYLNQAVEKGNYLFNMNNYRTRYWMINGRGFPDTIAPNFASWLPSQPYGALATVHPIDASNPLPSLERFANVGTEVIPMHPHAKNALIVNQDGRPVEGPLGEDLAWETSRFLSDPVRPMMVCSAISTRKDTIPTTTRCRSPSPICRIWSMAPCGAAARTWVTRDHSPWA